VQRPDSLRVRLIELLPSLASHTHQPHIAQHAQMLEPTADRSATPPQSRPPLLPYDQQGENLSSPRFSHGIEGIGSCRGTRHEENNAFDMGICQALFSDSRKCGFFESVCSGLVHRFSIRAYEKSASSPCSASICPAAFCSAYRFGRAFSHCASSPSSDPLAPTLGVKSAVEIDQECSNPSAI